MEASTQERQGQESADGRNVGRVEEITGVVIEVVFPDELPEINHALHIKRSKAMQEGQGENVPDTGGDILVCEVQQHLGDDRVRAVAMDSTDGLQRGTEVLDTGGPITVPVGRETLGRLFNLLGETIDHGEQVQTEERWPIHREAPEVDRPHPDHRDVRDRHQGRRPAGALREGRQGRAVRRRRRRQDRGDPRADPQPGPGARRPVGLLRRRRAHARGQRPLPGDDRVGRASTRRCSSSAR